VNVLMRSSLVTPRIRSAVKLRLLTRKDTKHSRDLTHSTDTVNVRVGKGTKEVMQPTSNIVQSASGRVLPYLIMHKMCPMPEQWQFHQDVSGGWEDNHERLRI
jgi:hypothetical protein